MSDKIRFGLINRLFMRILFVEDDTALGEVIVRALSSQGWAIDWIKVAESIPASLEVASYDLAILDVALPGIDGFEALRRLRAQGNKIPVLMLTAKDTIEDRVHGLQTGADDYLVKPFALAELLARIQALTRRTNAFLTDKFVIGKLRMDLTAKRAFIDDHAIELLPREWAVLIYLLKNVGKVVSKEQILEAVFGWDDTPASNTIEVYVSRLRSKIATTDVGIRTIRGFGYLLEESADGL